MFKQIKLFFYLSASLGLLFTVSCKKGTFDINNTNPNVPANVSPQFVLSGALKTSAAIVRGGDADFSELYMGYWALSGDYIPVTSTLTYVTTTDYFQDNWNSSYTVLRNYRQVELLASTDPNAVYFTAIAKIMEAYHFARLVDLYNNIPYSNALQGGTVNFPTYDDANTVYTSAINKLDSAVQIIATAPVTAENPNSYDVMFSGKMDKWVRFAHTVKLKALLNLSESSGGPAAVQAGLSGLTSADFLQAGEDAAINPAYSNSSNAQQSPFYQDMGFSTSGAAQNNESYYRANSYAVNFMYATFDTLRLYQIYAPNTQGKVKGRAFGSTAASGEDNQHVSGMGPGLLQTPASPAVILPACESFFMQAEAAQRGFSTTLGAPSALYKTAVEESFRLLLVPKAVSAADSFLTKSNSPNVNFSLSSNPLQTIILQEWVAVNGFDPVAAWNNWRRLQIPTDLPVSIFPGTTATHIPFRLLYPTTEYSYNDANVNKEGTISNMTSKIFWMP